jgi:hypothetical protein
VRPAASRKKVEGAPVADPSEANTFSTYSGTPSGWWYGLLSALAKQG